MFIPGFLISLATFPGVMVHELAHVVFCRLTETRVLKVCYFRLGNPAGYVIHEQPRTVWRHILIGIGPFFVNTLLGLMIGIVVIPMHIDIDHLTLVQLILLWLGISIAMHSFPSTGDARSIWHAVWSKRAPISARIIGSPLVAIIMLGAIGSIFFLNVLYGVGVVGAASALQIVSQRNDAATLRWPNYISGAHPPATRSVEQVIADVSRDMNAKLPMLVDKETRMDTTFAGPGRRLTYVYTLLGASAANIDQETLTAALRPSIVNGYKTIPGMAGLRAKGVELHYLYRDNSGKHIGEIVVSPNDF